MTRLQTRPVSPVGFRQGDLCRRSSVGRAPDFVSRYVGGPIPPVCTTPVPAGIPPHQGGGIATRPVSRHLRKRQGANGKTNVPPKTCSVFARRRFVGSIPTFRTRGVQTPRFRSGVPQYAVAVRRSTGFSSFFPGSCWNTGRPTPFKRRRGARQAAAPPIRGISSIGRTDDL